MDIISMLEPIIIAVFLGVGTGMIAYFRKIHKTNNDLCKKVERLQKTIIILAKMIDRQVKHDHPDNITELDDLVKELLYEKDN